MMYKSVHKFELNIDPNSLLINSIEHNIFTASSPLYVLSPNKTFADSLVTKYDDNESYTVVDKNIKRSKTCKLKTLCCVRHPLDRINMDEYYYEYVTPNGNQTFEFVHIYDLIENGMRRICPNYAIDAIKSSVIRHQYNGCVSGFDNTINMNMFTVGDFCKRHLRRALSPLHFATVFIIIPPINEELEHQGGLLRVWDNTGDIYEFDSNKISKITVIAVNPTFEYEITPIIAGTMIMFETNCYYNEAMLNLAVARNRNGLYDVNEKKMDHTNEINDIISIKNDINHELDGIISKLSSFDNINFSDFTNNFIKGIQGRLLAVDECMVRKERYKIDELVSHLKAIMKEKKFAIIPLLNLYDDYSLYSNELELFNALKRSFGKIGIKNMNKREKYYTRLHEPNDAYRYVTNENIEVEVSGEITPYETYSHVSDRLATRYVSLINTDRFIINKEKDLHGKFIKSWILEDGRYNRVHDSWRTYLIVRMLDYDAIMNFVGIWYLRKAECPHLGRVPKDVMKIIISQL